MIMERYAWMDRFGWPEERAKHMTRALMEQLRLCLSDEARRLILGVSE